MSNENNVVEFFPVWKQALKNYVDSNPQPGSVVTKKWLMDQFRIAEPVTASDLHEANLEFLQNFSRFKDELLQDYLIALRANHDGGYEVVPPNQQTRMAIEVGIKEIRRSYNKMHLTAACVNKDALTEAERTENTDGLAKIAAMRAMVSRRKLLGR